MVLPPTTGIQSLEFRLSVLVLLKDFNFELATSFPKKIGSNSGQGGCLSRVRRRGGHCGWGLLGGPRQGCICPKSEKIPHNRLLLSLNFYHHTFYCQKIKEIILIPNWGFHQNPAQELSLKQMNDL